MFRIAMSLGSRLVLRLSLGLIMGAAMLFIPAGSLRFWRGWTFLATLFIPAVLSFLYFYRHDRQLVERRLRTHEKIAEQKRLIRLSKPFFFAAFLLPGLDFRLGWSRALMGAMPPWLSLVFQGLALGGFLLLVWVMRVNRFASRTIQVEPGQRVVSTGPYRMVRHPLYSGSLVILLSTPLALGSYLAWPVFALLIPFYVFRLIDEEKLLRQELPGYPEYCLRTPFRLVPFVW
jgi:protein-S-isoprenylcysteine O-methyltransferase Ste14